MLIGNAKQLLRQIKGAYVDATGTSEELLGDAKKSAENLIRQLSEVPDEPEDQ